MNNRIRKKLRSEKGASITFGLLIFLVCAVLCSVILAAATSSAGRMANMADSDQRYYSVTSACELMKDLIDGKTVTVVKTGSGDDAATYVVPDMTAGQAVTSDLSTYLVGDQYSAPSIVCDAAYRYSKGKPAAGSFLTGTLSVDSFGLGSPDPASATVSEKINRNGDIILTVAREGKNSGNQFAMEMTFSADVSQESFSRQTDNIGDNEDEDTPETTTTESMSATTMNWNILGMKIVSPSGAGQ